MATQSTTVILNDSILLSSHWVRSHFFNGYQYQSHQEELVQFSTTAFSCIQPEEQQLIEDEVWCQRSHPRVQNRIMNIERRPSQPAEMGPCVLALPFRIHSPQFQVFKECAEVQGSTESTVAERRARSDFAVKSSRIAFLWFFFITPHESTVDSRIAESCLQSFFWGWEYLR